MRDDKLKTVILELVEPILEQDNAEIAELVLSRYKSDITLRFFVYLGQTPTVGDYAQLSRKIGEVLDESNLMKDGYMLEVSSPGLDRPLTTASDFRYRCGETVKVEFVESTRKAFTGELVSSDEMSVRLKENEETVEIPLAEIRQAIIVF